MQTEHRASRTKGTPLGASIKSEELPYRIELTAQRRLIARARSHALARTIFRAACEEYPDEEMVLKRGSKVVARRAKP